MKIGIVGFAGSGKTTLFNALTGQNAPVGFGGKVNLGSIKVPDSRVDRLVELNDPKKTTYTEITFADVPGGRGSTSLDPQTLGRIREMDALVQVVRGFDDGSGKIEPADEFLSFESELIISDMQVAEKRVDRLKRDHSDKQQLALLEQLLEALGEETPLRNVELSPAQKASLSGFAFLSLKPMMLILSLPEGEPTDALPKKLAAITEKKNIAALALCGSIEAEIASLDPDDQAEFLADMGLKEPASVRFITKAYEMLDLITFFTHGPDECRAWSLRRGSTSVDAAGTIHSDLARGFIRAEVIAFDDLDKLGSESACRDAGKLRVEGKDYIVKDGDICHIRFNV